MHHAKRIHAAYELLQTETLNTGTFEEVRTLLSGINAKLDGTLAAAGKAYKQIEHLQKGDVVELTLEAIPDATPEDKKRKKAILFFLKFWKDLESEVARIEKELGHTDTNTPAKILSHAKGPLGIITLIAAVVAVMKVSEVSITIKNIDCQPIAPPTGFALNIPGLKVPSETIPSGGQAEAKLPPLQATVDATSSRNVQLKMYGMTFNFALESSGIQLFFNDKLLNGRLTSINLGSQKTHTLKVVCE